MSADKKILDHLKILAAQGAIWSDVEKIISKDINDLKNDFQSLQQKSTNEVIRIIKILLSLDGPACAADSMITRDDKAPLSLAIKNHLGE